MNIIQRFFSVEYMVKKEQMLGEPLETRAAYSNLLNIAIPSIIEMVFVALIGSVDVIMVGRLGYEAIAAVGLAGQPWFIVLSMFIALNVGVTAIVARRKGENLPDKASQTVRNALVLVVGLTVVVTTLTLVFSRQILLIAGAIPGETLEMADEYFRIMVYFLPVNTITLCINAAQRGVGDTRITMVANLAANVANIIGDLLLIYGNWGFPKLGVAGDAWGSGIGFCVGMIVSVVAAFTSKGSSHFLHISLKEDWRLKKETVMSILKIGGNSAIEQVAQRIGFFIYVIVIANLGTEVFAAHQVGMQFLSLSFNFASGLATAGITMVGQMLGQKRADLATIYGKCAQRLAVITSILLASSIVLFRYPFIGIFLDRKDAANFMTVDIAASIMLMVALIQLPQTSSAVFAGCLRGAGDNLYVAITMIICVTFIRPVLCIVAVYIFKVGVIGAWSAAFVEMCVRLTFVYRRFSGTKWHDIKV